jgi:hypothetical protein
MNANDLADRLEEFYSGTHIQKAAEVLRQLQAENELLESKRMIAYNIGYEDGRKAQEK